MEVMQYPKDGHYHHTFEEVRQFIENLNESHTYLLYHWSRWEWYFARGTFNDHALDKNFLFYDQGNLQGILILEDEPHIYYYLAKSKAAKISILKQFNTLTGYQLMVEDTDKEMLDMIHYEGFIETDYIEHMSKLETDRISYELKDGYQLQCLNDRYDVKKHHQVLFNGFENPGDIEFSKETLIKRENELGSPHFNRNYAYVTTHNNQYVAYASIWYKKGNKVALIEPVATLPEHRRKGCAKAAIAACVEAAKKDGATTILVGSNQKFYQSIGFNVIRLSRVYKKEEKENE